MHALFARLSLAAGALALTACSSYGPPAGWAGMNRDDLVARMGPPETVRPLEGGSRLEFPLGPYGRETWFVYLDGAGRAVRAEQVLTEQNFRLILPGMGQEQVRQMLGRPGETFVLARHRGSVWNYRYENTSCVWFQVELTAENTVRSAGNGPAPECNPRMND